MNNFININLNNSNIDIFYIRASILKGINESMHLFSGNLLDVGCGKMPYKDHILSKSNITKYIGLDIETSIIYDSNIKPDYTWNGVKMPFENEIFDTAFGTEVLEHCPKPEIILNEIFRVLKPGGILFGTIPFLWPLHEVPNDEYRYTPFSLERLLLSSGFENIEIKSTGGWHASMAQMLGLWVRRSPMSSRKRKILVRLFKPIIKKLINLDKNIKIDFKESQMITGLIFTVKKPTASK
ncbi:methyltransferase type 11 [Flavivirga aquatica]|uniref:Methyltransferase type 11 n=1 Tax=Flavivirga aquatica TaxID=1849968 RepID=A0A1E5TBV1_9FLAO|nr:class I SAM-dependent methyltransferase [Flavivirga aquatica]OEK08838.1 methyltransferase type 11 [Flavivirga aquatica]